jgi:hypothetical protein
MAPVPLVCCNLPRAAADGWYGFVSLFPLLLVLATVLGFVLRDDPGLDDDDDVDAAIGQFPAIGGDLPAARVEERREGGADRGGVRVSRLAPT